MKNIKNAQIGFRVSERDKANIEKAVRQGKFKSTGKFFIMLFDRYAREVL